MKNIDELIQNQQSDIEADMIESEAESFRLAFKYALGYVAKAPRSEREVRNKLYEKEFHKHDVDAAIAKLKDYRYVDDEQYVLTFLEFNSKKYGKKKIEFKLVNDKGVDKKLVERIMSENVDADDEKERCVAFALKFIKSKHLECSPKDKAKLGNHLFSKGFDWNTINYAVEKTMSAVDIESC